MPELAKRRYAVHLLDRGGKPYPRPTMTFTTAEEAANFIIRVCGAERHVVHDRASNKAYHARDFADRYGEGKTDK